MFVVKKRGKWENFFSNYLKDISEKFLKKKYLMLMEKIYLRRYTLKISIKCFML